MSSTARPTPARPPGSTDPPAPAPGASSSPARGASLGGLTARPWWPWVTTVVRLGLGAVALAAAVPKLTDLRGSVWAVRAYDLMPVALAEVVGTALPFVELLLGVLLVTGLWTRWAAAGFGLLMLAFAAGIASAWARGLAIDCGCFGGGGEVDPEATTYLVDLLRDGAFLLLAALVVWRPRSRLSLDGALAPVAPAPERNPHVPE